MERFNDWLKSKHGKAVLAVLLTAVFLQSGCRLLRSIEDRAINMISNPTTKDTKTDNATPADSGGTETDRIGPLHAPAPNQWKGDDLSKPKQKLPLTE